MRRLLVANRGEIAVRIIESATLMGLETVAIYPDDDRDTLHVTRAAESLLIPGAGPAAYLDVEAVVGAAKEAGCDALHPGLGFLSENATLAQRCADEGITFVGPDADALRLFGDKSTAREQAVKAQIPIARATSGPTTLEQARELMSELGPDGAVMVKAIAGGGGRGMAAVTDPAQLPQAFERCAAEAQAAFGNGDLYVEQLVRAAHHVEVQIVADRHGGVAAVGDRDCSVQRRRQKLIEIAPAPWITDDVRRRLHDAAETLIGQAAYAGLATVEFLVAGDEIIFLEVNPRIQVEHTVTEEVTGLDLVEVSLRIAAGASIDELAVARSPQPQGFSVQARVNSETLMPDGSVHPGTGRITRFQPPSGRGVRVDSHGYAGYTISPRYDSLLAKVICNGVSLDAALLRTDRALADLDVAGVPTNATLLRAILADPAMAAGEIDTAYVDAHLDRLLQAASTKETVVRGQDSDDEPAHQQLDVDDDAIAVIAPMQGVVVEISVAEGQQVAAGDEVVVVEAMKMQHVVTAETAGVVRAIAIEVGDVTTDGQPLIYLDDAETGETEIRATEEIDLDLIRPDLQESIDRHHHGLDEGRAEAVDKWHAKGRRTARENIADLVDEGSFVEYGALTIAAQRRRRSLQDLIERTTGDGVILGTATINGMPVAVMSYDYLVLAGTQGLQNHRKTDRFLDVAARNGLPVVLFAEGGGGRPGDTDHPYVAQLEVPTFRTLASLVGEVPIVCVVSGYCFAGNAALVGCADVVIATKEASLGMGGPAMIEGGGLGVFKPSEVGPTSVQYANGVIDVLVDDEQQAVAHAREAIQLLGGRRGDTVEAEDQRAMRHFVPENRLRSYDIRPVMRALADSGSLIELRSGWGAGIVTAIARMDGIPVGIMANNPHHLGGAIDHDAAEKATRFLTMCQAHQLPVVSLCDTPGFMVGPDSEKHGTVRKFGAFFVAGARVTTPIVAVVLRKGYGLGVMAMACGSLHAPVLTVAWPTGEFGGMGLEGAVRLGYRKELEAISDPRERKHRYDELVAEQYERGKALSTAASFEIDDVIDPADTRAVVVRALRASIA